MNLPPARPGSCITLLGTASIQEYVFATNRLHENTGASELARVALEEPWKSSPHRIFVGGGNAALLFPDPDTAHSEVRVWSRRVLEEAPGLRVVAAHQPVGDSFRAAWVAAQRKLRDAEEAPAYGAELGQLPVVRQCASTGRGASVFYEEAWISRESHAKREAGKQARKNLDTRYRHAHERVYQFPYEFENLGPEEGASQIAIVHADGNGVGKLFKHLVEQYDGDDLIRALHEFSAEITSLAYRSVAATLDDLVQALRPLEDQGIHCAEGKRTKYLPFRPIVDAGDDLTFVCHGRLGMSLAVRYLRHFERLSACLVGRYSTKPLTACAGVLVMPGKFPFARGYRMAEQLSGIAKKKRREAVSRGLDDTGWLSFHIVLEGATGGEPGGRTFHLGSWDSTDSWNRFERLWRVFRNPDRWPRSRAKQLFQALSSGSAALEKARIQAAGIRLPEGASDDDCMAPLEFLDFPIQWPEVS